MIVSRMDRRGPAVLLSVAGAVAICFATASAFAQNLGPDYGAKGSDNAGGIELIDPTTLRVCADPNNLPFSNEKGEGFENKLAELLAAKMHKQVAYAFYPGASGFVRNTLNVHLCDVILGMPQGNDLVQPTNPYYRTSYVIVTREGSELDGVRALDDPKLKDKHHRIGLVANTPPGNVLAKNGLMGDVKPYPLMIDTRVDSSSATMIRDLEKGDIDMAVLWGPIGGYYAKKSSARLHVVPVAETPGTRMAFRIGLGVRHSDQNWKRELNTLLAQNKAEIDKILEDYGVPNIEDAGQPAEKAP